MKLILADSPEVHVALLPLTFTRPAAELPAGIEHTIAERWRYFLPDLEIGYATEPYLQEKFPAIECDLYVCGNVIPSPQLAELLPHLAEGEYISDTTGAVIARRGTTVGEPKAIIEVKAYRKVTDIFRLSKELIAADFALLTKGRVGAPLPESSTLIGPADQLFIEEGASVEGCFINTKMGPVYIGRNSDIQEGTVIRGPVAVGSECRLRAGGRLLPGVNLGPSTRVGGEISNTVFLGYSNKQHDGFVGDAVIGQWCNLGADCVASNLKNDYSEIRLWSYASQRFDRTGLQFCGLIMGDHCKAAINTMFNTATVVGPGCNIHGSGFPRPYVAAFSNGGAQGIVRENFKKFIVTATEMMRHRAVDISEADIHILEHLYNNA